MSGFTLILIILTAILASMFVGSECRYYVEKLSHNSTKVDRDHYMQMSDIRKVESRALKKELSALKLLNKSLEFQIEQLKEQNNVSLAVSKEIMDAVRYAMIHSHPDKGGKQEDFIRFHNLYEKMK